MAENREYQKAIDYLYGLVEENKISIGDKLPTERKMSEMLSIGRNSTREALKMLEKLGMIESRQGSGNYLVANMSNTISKCIEMMIMLNQTSQMEVIAFRRELDLIISKEIIPKDTVSYIFNCHFIRFRHLRSMPQTTGKGIVTAVNAICVHTASARCSQGLDPRMNSIEKSLPVVGTALEYDCQPHHFLFLNIDETKAVNLYTATVKPGLPILYSRRLNTCPVLNENIPRPLSSAII